MPSPISFQPPRRLRVFAFDPSVGNRHANRAIREMTLSIPWDLDPIPSDQSFLGPDGEYLQVIDYDPASAVFYEPIDLNAPKVLFNDGLTPSEENPQFHQQMVYAVAMDTISTFEEALGRVVLWSPRGLSIDGSYVGKLRIYPHALREANAFYDPEKKALLFGYFNAPQISTSAPPGTTVFTCLSHDVIVHETCHAILDGMHPKFVENSNPDMLALHEAFADMVAIFQHFSHPQVLEDQIARTHGDLERQSLLGALAQEFGEAVGHGGALRDALGHVVDGEWRPRLPDNTALGRAKGPHARGAILVAAVFRGYLSIYKARVADLFRIASAGSGILRDGEVDPDLCRRLAGEAAKSARHVLRMCIRAMDYVPPVDVDFGAYLRGIVTADHDLYPEDEHGYRRAMIEAFAAWGILPDDLPVVTEAALLWPELREKAADLRQQGAIEKMEGKFGVLIGQPETILQELKDRNNEWDDAGDELIARLGEIENRIVARQNKTLSISTHMNATGMRAEVSREQVLQRDLLGSSDRETAYLARRYFSQLFWGIIVGQNAETLQRTIGIDLGDVAATIERSEVNGLPKVWIASVRMAKRVGKRGQQESEYVVEIIQSRDGFFDPKLQKLADEGDDAGFGELWRATHGAKKPRRDFRYRAGVTLLIDTRTFEIRRVIASRYSVGQREGIERMRQHLLTSEESAPNAFDGHDGHAHATGNTFAALHRHVAREPGR